MIEGVPEDKILAPLIVRTTCGEADETLRENIERTLSSEYVRFNELLQSKTGVVSIVGSGPSLAETWQDLTGDVIACNGALGFLLEKGVVPTFAFLFDGNEVMEKFAIPHPEVTYLLASRCHEKVFQKLKDCKVVVFHAMGDECLQELLEKHGKMEPMIKGGSTSTGRAMVLATPMGYEEIHLFGADGSFPGKQVHVKEDVVPESPITVWCHGRLFETTAWLAGQIVDFNQLAPVMRDWGIRLVLHGDGLLQHRAKNLNFEVIHKESHVATTCV